MEIRLYKTVDEQNRVQKTLTDEKILTGTLRDETSIINPSIHIEIGPEIVGYNYAYIPDFGRYYFITDITAVNHKIFRIDLNVDVLQTYWNSLRELSVIVARQEKNFNLYVNDDQFKVQSNNQVVTLLSDKTDVFGGFYSFLLLVNGG